MTAQPKHPDGARPLVDALLGQFSKRQAYPTPTHDCYWGEDGNFHHSLHGPVYRVEGKTPEEPAMNIMAVILIDEGKLTTGFRSWGESRDSVVTILPVELPLPTGGDLSTAQLVLLGALENIVAMAVERFTSAAKYLELSYESLPPSSA